MVGRQRRMIGVPYPEAAQFHFWPGANRFDPNCVYIVGHPWPKLISTTAISHGEPSPTD